jgi:hypothetical protein
MTRGGPNFIGQVELRGPSAADLAHWLEVAGVGRPAAESCARVAPLMRCPGRLAGLPPGISLRWETVGHLRVYRLDWARRIEAEAGITSCASRSRPA